MNLNSAGFDAIILAGGFGTRLKTVTGELPKPLADIAGRPFLACLLDYLVQQGCTRFILSTCYRHDLIMAAFGNSYRNIPITYVVEQSPLGTGGAVREAFAAVETEHAVVLNGDTFFAVDLADMMERHVSSAALVTIALKPMANCSRYGTVTVEGLAVRSFEEKGVRASGYINGGVYLMSKAVRPLLDACGTAFSIETDFFQKKTDAVSLAAYISDTYFIDIGIPEDYKRACVEIPVMFAATGSNLP